MSGTAAVVSAAAASFRYAGSARTVGPFDFAAYPGEFHLISGPSGCGKSTLARMLCGLIPHLYRGQHHGRIHIAERPSAETPLWWLTTRVGCVAQNPAAQLLASSVREEIVFGLENLGLTDSEITARTGAAIDRFGLETLSERDPRTLSGGEQQKLVLAAIVARRPDGLVLDEPLSMLDSASARHIVGALAALSREGCAVVAFEHRDALFAGVDGVRRRALCVGELPLPSLPDLPVQVAPFRLAVEGLCVALGGQPVLEGINCTLAGGRIVAVVGPNGSGKTTLLRALTGLQQYAGRISAYASGGQHPPRLGLCFQNSDRQLFNPTVRQELRFGLSRVDETLYRTVVDLLGLAPYEHTAPLLLSEGEKKRVALATALLQPQLSGICLDEPTLGQDAYHRRILGRVLQRLAAAGYLCVVATHDVEWVSEWCDEMLVLQGGRLVGVGNPRALVDREQLRRMQPEELANTWAVT